MATQIKSLMFAAAVAILPVACGTGGSPTGMDVAAIEAGSGLSALRREPLPPQAPEPQSPENEPAVPADPGSIPEVKPQPGADVPTSVPSNRPSPVADADAVPPPPPPPSSDSDPVGSDESDPVATDDTVPTTVPPTSDPSEGPHAIPAPPPPTGDPLPTPLPETVPSSVCEAASMVISPLVTAVAPDGDAFVATLLDRKGVVIEDMSCEKILWSAVGVDSGHLGIRITYGHLSRYVTVNGTVGAYLLQAQAPNGIVASINFGAGRN